MFHKQCDETVSYSIAGFIFSLLILIATVTQATHLRAADIKVEPVCGSPRAYTITILAYLHTQSNTGFGPNSEVFFGDGSSVRIPLTVATVRPDLRPNIAVATFTATHTYQGFGNYTGTYIEHDRSTANTSIKWDGKSTQGNELTGGVYFYRAEVTFNRLYERDRHKELTGYVHLVR